MEFWERAFSLQPLKGASGRKKYTDRHIQKFKYIRNLLKEQGYTLRGAVAVFKHGISSTSFNEKVVQSARKLFDAEYVKKNELLLLAFAVQLRQDGILDSD